jgi:prophage maintenance system killer protein
MADQAVFIVPDDGAQIDVRIESETVWLTPAQMSELFGRELSVIHRHIRNTFAQGEVPDEGGYRQNLPITSPTGGRPEVLYSLDVIISVGYRVKSPRGVAFRQWATRVLKQHLLAEHKKRSTQAEQYLAGLKNVELLANQSEADAADVLGLIGRYARSWRLLLQYDEGQLPPPPTQPTVRMQRLTLKQANQVIDRFKATLAREGQATDLFGRVREQGFESILLNLEQTFGGQALYPNVETRAANLLYLVIKDHPFFDGNKRIGSLLFLHYLGKNRRKLMDQNALVALALLIAESEPRQKDIVVRLIIGLMAEA